MTTGEVIALIKAFGGGSGGGGSSGGGVLYVTLSQDMALDKNLEEIQTALDGGKVVMLKTESPDDGVFYSPLTGIYSSPDPEYAYYNVRFYSFSMAQEGVFSNRTSPTDPLVLED